MKLNRLLLVPIIVFLATCKDPTQGIKPTEGIKINSDILQKYAGEKNTYIIMSCVRCSCFDGDLKRIKPADIEYLRQFIFITDTTCGKIEFSNAHLSQNIIDSISDDIYNITLIKRNSNNGFLVRIIKQEESTQFLKICRTFF